MDHLGGSDRQLLEAAGAAGAAALHSCAGCNAVLFDAGAQFDSGTGWPSFFDAEDGVELHRDFSLLVPRTEVRCRRCGGHLGHVFGGGPRPTRKRYYINAAALRFEAARPSSGGDVPPP